MKIRSDYMAAIFVSVLVHVVIIFIIAGFETSTVLVPFGDGVIAVDVFNGPSGPSKIPKASDFFPKNKVLPSNSPLSSPSSANLNAGSPIGNSLLREIRSKIERAKYYPQSARNQKIEGRAEISFQISSDGSISSTSIKRSSGHSMLDSAAIETIRRAAPLPYFEQPITIAIKFSLKDPF